MGSVYKRGNIYWVKYYDSTGKCHRESSESTKKKVAEKFLARREGEIAQGKLPGILFERVTFDELAKNVITDYRINQRRSLTRLKGSIKHLESLFKNLSVTQITTPKIKKYVEQRLDEGASNATINRELSALKRMLNLGARETPPLVDRVPYIPMLKENNTRKGFFEHEEYLALHKAVPKYLKGFIAFAYRSGWRVSEIAGLKWSNVDLNQGIVRLDSGTTKNSEGRTFYLESIGFSILAPNIADRW